MDLLLEAAKQVPALVVIAYLVIYLTQKSEDRLTKIIDQQNETIKSVVSAMQAGNETLGAVKTLFLVLDKELRDAAKRNKP